MNCVVVPSCGKLVRESCSWDPRAREDYSNKVMDDSLLELLTKFKEVHYFGGASESST